MHAVAYHLLGLRGVTSRLRRSDVAAGVAKRVEGCERVHRSFELAPVTRAAILRGAMHSSRRRCAAAGQRTPLVRHLPPTTPLDEPLKASACAEFAASHLFASPARCTFHLDGAAWHTLRIRRATSAF